MIILKLESPEVSRIVACLNKVIIDDERFLDTPTLSIDARAWGEKHLEETRKLKEKICNQFTIQALAMKVSEEKANKGVKELPKKEEKTKRKGRPKKNESKAYFG